MYAHYVQEAGGLLIPGLLAPYLPTKAMSYPHKIKEVEKKQ